MGKRAKRIIVVSIALVLAISVYFGISAFKELRQLAHTIFPNSLTVFNKSMKPVMVKIGQVQYQVPKAYINMQPDLLKEKEVSELRIWASLNDDMAPWPVSASFRKRDESGVVIIYIYSGMIESYRSEFPYNEINLSKKRGGGADRGVYKEIFTRYDDVPMKTILPWEQGIQWYEEHYKTKWKYLNAKFYPTGDGTITEEVLHKFFLIPKNQSKYFIECPAIGNPADINCNVTVLYAPTITYKFLIPMRIVEHFLEYDKQVQKLIEQLIYHPNQGSVK